MASASYVIGIGSNRHHGRHGAPRRIVVAAIAAIAASGLVIAATSRTRRSTAIGPSARDFANAAVLVRSDLAPPALLALLKRIEREFGRRRGRRWGARVLDLDILAWSQGTWRDPSLTIPHVALAARGFAIGPAAEIAPHWRHRQLGATFRQLDSRARRRRVVDHSPRAQ